MFKFRTQGHWVLNVEYCLLGISKILDDLFFQSLKTFVGDFSKHWKIAGEAELGGVGTVVENGVDDVPGGDVARVA